MLTRCEYAPYSGQLHRITTGIEESQILPLIRDLTYTYDGADNVLTRGDAISGHQDSYGYDAFDRLTDAVRTTPGGKGGFSLSYGYDIHGNLDYKSAPYVRLVVAFIDFDNWGRNGQKYAALCC